MALLLDIRMPEWMREEDLRGQLVTVLPGVPVYCGLEDAALRADDVTAIAAVGLYPGVVARLPNLKLVQKLGAGVDSIVSDPDLPADIRITRLKPNGPAREISEYCLAYVLRDQRSMLRHAANTATRDWESIPPKINRETTVGVLGLGHIGGRTASLFAHLGFRVLGWARSQKTIDGVDCRWGEDALPPLLGECDFVAGILPSTAETRNLFDQKMFAAMKPCAVLINAGRGDLIVEDDLVAALDSGLGGAVLDVFRTEPLPKQHPFWGHEKVTITPHVSGWHAEDAFREVAENYKRLTDGRPLLNEVDRDAGY